MPFAIIMMLGHHGNNLRRFVVSCYLYGNCLQLVFSRRRGWRWRAHVQHQDTRTRGRQGCGTMLQPQPDSSRHKTRSLFRKIKQGGGYLSSFCNKWATSKARWRQRTCCVYECESDWHGSRCNSTGKQQKTTTNDMCAIIRARTSTWKHVHHPSRDFPYNSWP